MTYLNLMRKNCAPYMIILKDSVKISNEFSSIYSKLIELLKTKNYDFISLDKQASGRDLSIVSDKSKPNIESCSGFIISQVAVQKILETISVNGIKKADYLQEIELDTYLLTKELYSIQTSHEFDPIEIIPELPGYKFYSQLDSRGGDIGYYGNKSIDNYREICDRENCLAFNTLGYIKNKIVDEKEFIYLPNSTKATEGMYVKI